MDLMGFALFSLSSLFAVIDPLGCIPFFSGQTAGMDGKTKARVLFRALFVSLLLLLLFTYAGTAVLHTFGITIDAFRIAGGVIFFGIGLDMLQSKPRRWRTGIDRAFQTDHPDASGETAGDVEALPVEPRRLEPLHEPGHDPSVTPLAIPMIAGPGSITTVMVLRAEAGTSEKLLVVAGAVVAILLLTGIILWAADQVLTRLGETGMKIVEKLMGLLVTVIAVQLILNGFAPYFRSLLSEGM
ncbi:MAG: MarC family protein [Candidatus Eisenbacteria bacterium]|nr:MarC family protein [Candidatus Eisenbacteria bacterium]